MIMKPPEHQKPTFTDIVEIKHRIEKVRCNLNDTKSLLEELQDAIDDLEEVGKHD